MATIRIKRQELPAVLPHGWKKEVATALGVHRNTIHNNLKEGKGEMYERIIKCATAKYGKKTE